VAYDLNRTHVEQINDLCFTPLCLLGCKEAPVAVTNGSKITVSYPMGLFVWVSSFSPHPEVFEDAIVSVVKGFLGGRVAVVVNQNSKYQLILSISQACFLFHILLFGQGI
jgi:hypothetical protein